MIPKDIDERTNLILETSPNAVILFDRHMKPIDCNERALEMLGFTDKQEYMKKFYTLFPARQPNGSDSIEMVAHYFSKALDDGIAYMPEFICCRADGTTFPVETTYTRIVYNNDYAIVEYSNDITEKMLHAKGRMHLKKDCVSRNSVTTFD